MRVIGELQVSRQVQIRQLLRTKCKMAHRLGNKNYRLPLSGHLLKRCRILFAAYMNWWNAKCQILPVGAYNIVLYFFICQISIHIAIISSSDIGPNMKNILGEYSLFFKASTWNYLHLNWICLFEEHIQWNADFSNLQGKCKLVREIESGIKLRLIGRVLCDYE